VDSADELRYVRQAQAGEGTAFAALVEEYWGRIYRWLYGLTGQPHTAEDLTQETFLKAWAGLPAFVTGQAFKTWLFRIARNCLIDHNRRARARRQASAQCQEIEENRPHEPEPVTNLIEQENQGLLAKACAQLPAIYRAAFFLWTHEELPYAEIARILGITEETARWRVCKARQHLLKRLGSQLDQKTL
jgi:RNA polymerase sigma-70 factor (ECF subfamily)